VSGNHYGLNSTVAAASMLLPLPLIGGPTGPSELVFYAAEPGAFVDLASGARTSMHQGVPPPHAQSEMKLRARAANISVLRGAPDVGDSGGLHMKHASPFGAAGVLHVPVADAWCDSRNLVGSVAYWKTWSAGSIDFPCWCRSAPSQAFTANRAAYRFK
jgi:hypothetical protein